MQLSAIDPKEIRILTERKDGSGVIEMPILSPMTYDRALTAGGGKGMDSVTSADLEAAVANFSEWPGPVPIHRAPHRKYSETAGPSDGFIDKLFMRGGQLWAQMDLTPALFGEVKGRQWRGFSIDGAPRCKTATKSFDSFVVFGGVFTNRPASDVHARIAAGSGIEADLCTIHRPITGDTMADDTATDTKVSLAAAQAELNVKNEKITSLESRVDALSKDVIEKEKDRATAATKLASTLQDAATIKLSNERLEQQHATDQERITQLETERNELKAKLSAKETESVGAKVLQLTSRAVRDGVPPAKMKVFGDYEKDPVGFASRLGGLESMELVLKSLPRDAALSAVNSGRPKPEDDDDSAAISPDTAASLRALGLNPEFAAAKTESEMQAIRDRQKKA